MCDYSLQAFKSRPATVGDKLITKNFGTGTSGFTLEGGDAEVATCVLPGTELAFDKPIEHYNVLWDGSQTKAHNTAIFRQVNKEIQNVHHDQLELPDGNLVMLTQMAPGQRATVLQLPAAPRNEAEREEQRRAEYV